MMILHKGFEKRINLQAIGLNFVVVEDKLLFDKVVMNVHECITQQADLISIYTGDSILDMKKHCELITSPLDLFFDKKRIQKALYEILKEELDLQELNVEIADTYQMMFDCLRKLDIFCEFDLEYKEDDVDILKMFDVRLKEPCGSFTERLIEVITCLHRLNDRKIFFVVNCDGFITENDYSFLEMVAKNQELSIVFVNNRQVYLNEEQNQYIIDSDMCEIHEEYH